MAQRGSNEVGSSWQMPSTRCEVRVASEGARWDGVTTSGRADTVDVARTNQAQVGGGGGGSEQSGSTEGLRIALWLTKSQKG
jgi:hypothetical protein